MSDEWTTISVRESTRDRFNNAKRERTKHSGALNVSADVFVNQLLDAWENADEDDESGELGERLDRVESAVGTVEERTGRIERVLEELSGGHQ